MSDLTKIERDLVLRAASLIADGNYKYSCTALEFCEAIEISDYYANFYGQSEFLYWKDLDPFSRSELTPKEQRCARVLMLLTFAEIG